MIAERTQLGRCSLPKPFVGRERELAELQDGLRDAIEGRGSLVLVAGEPGIGKTALAERLLDVAAPPGMSRAEESLVGGRRPASYWTWVQIVRLLLDAIDDETVRALLPGDYANP